MNLQQLQYFRTVAEGGQVTKAAKLLHTSQPTVSMSIAALEDELNVALFEKQGRLLHLTPIGQVFLGHIAKALDEIEYGRLKLEQFTATTLKTIHIASTYSLSLSLIPPLVKQFTQKYPDTIFHLKQVSNLELLDNLIKGDADFIFGRIIPDENKNKSIIHIPLFSEELVILMHKQHSLAFHHQLEMEQLRNENFIFFHESTGYNAIVTELFQIFNIKPNIRYVVHDNATCAALVSENEGIALVVPSEAYDSTILRQIKLKTPPQYHPAEVCLHYRDDVSWSSGSYCHFLLAYIKTLDFNDILKRPKPY
ncbi:MAG: LysR family transcriptional regulator [Lachnospiraceae bacterium]